MRSMRYLGILLSLSLVSFSCTLAKSKTNQINRDPLQQAPGLLDVSSAVAISNSDFTSGTYRITQPGYYYLSENIVFDPDPAAEAGRSDKPATGWFTALSIECDNVIIDLNTKTMECSQNFLAKQFFKVFSLIELANSPFPHLIFSFTGEPSFKRARNVTIRNGSLGRSPHHGIHGNQNTNIRIYDLTIKDWEVAGISLNGLKNGEIKDCLISGIEHQVPFTGLMALMQAALLELNILKDNGDTGAQAHIDAMSALLNDPYENGTAHSGGRHDANAYGILLNRSVNVGPVATAHEEITTDCVIINNVTVCNMRSSILETVGMKDSSGKTLKGLRFGILRWVDAYPGGVFAPNDRIKAQIYAAHAKEPSSYPAGFADNMLSETPDESLFLSHVTPLFNNDFAGHTNKGVFGIRVDVAHGVIIKNCNVMSLDNIGPKGSSKEDFPSVSDEDFIRYRGNDVFGISLAGCHSCSVEDTNVFNCGSENGYVFGVAVTGNSVANKFKNVCSNNHYVKLESDDTLVNRSSEVCGFYIEDNSDANFFEDCSSSALESSYRSYGSLVVNSRANVFFNCSANNHVVSSKNNSDARAVGFASLGSVGTVFNECLAGNMLCKNNETSSSAAASYGFFADAFQGVADKDMLMMESFARSNNGTGASIGAYFGDVQYATVSKNTFCNNRALSDDGTGYGIRAINGDLLLIMQNFAYSNTTANFSVDYASAVHTLPVIHGTLSAVPPLSAREDGQNISLSHS